MFESTVMDEFVTLFLVEGVWWTVTPSINSAVCSVDLVV